MTGVDPQKGRPAIEAIRRLQGAIHVQRLQLVSLGVENEMLKTENDRLREELRKTRNQ